MVSLVRAQQFFDSVGLACAVGNPNLGPQQSCPFNVFAVVFGEVLCVDIAVKIFSMEFSLKLPMNELEGGEEHDRSVLL